MMPQVSENCPLSGRYIGRMGIYRFTCFPKVGSLVDDGVGRLIKKHPHVRADLFNLWPSPIALA